MAEKRNFKWNNYNKALYKTRIYRIWSNMKTRCSNTNIKDYYRYWWRWISFCEKWKHFEWFYEDMKDWYSESLTLDRINNNWNYCKENCRWTDLKTQSNNRISNTIIEFNWVKKTLEEWSRFLNIKSSTLRQRYFSYRWDIEKCLTFKK